MRSLTPLQKRRLGLFKANKRGFVSFVLFLALFIVTLFSEFVANDKPLLISYKGNYYIPVVQFYPETAFDGDFETEADYKDLYVQNLIEKAGGSIIWPLIPFSDSSIDKNEPHPAPAPPSARHWLGTDDQQRDVLARILYGCRVSILFGLLLTFFSSLLGLFMGAIQGYFGGKLDLILQRFIEIWNAMPTLYILLILSSMLIPSFWILLTIMFLFSWTALVGIVRAEFLRARNFDYVRAAKALGVSDYRIMIRHILPNAMVVILTMLPFIVSGATTTLASLDFLGLGLPPGSPSLGELILQGKNNLQAPWLGFTAFFVVGGLLALLVFIGEATKDAFDPRKIKM